MKDPTNIFCRCKNHHDDSTFGCADPKMIIDSLNYAKEQLDYSNFDNDKLDRSIEAVKLVAKQNNIPMQFVGTTFHE